MKARSHWLRAFFVTLGKPCTWSASGPSGLEAVADLHAVHARLAVDAGLEAEALGDQPQDADTVGLVEHVVAEDRGIDPATGDLVPLRAKVEQAIGLLQ